MWHVTLTPRWVRMVSPGLRSLDPGCLLLPSTRNRFPCLLGSIECIGVFVSVKLALREPNSRLTVSLYHSLPFAASSRFRYGLHPSLLILVSSVPVIWHLFAVFDTSFWLYARSLGVQPQGWTGLTGLTAVAQPEKVGGVSGLWCGRTQCWRMAASMVSCSSAHVCSSTLLGESALYSIQSLLLKIIDLPENEKPRLRLRDRAFGFHAFSRIGAEPGQLSAPTSSPLREPEPGFGRSVSGLA